MQHLGNEHADPGNICKVLSYFVTAPTKEDVIRMCELSKVLAVEEFKLFGDAFIKAFIRRHVMGQASLKREKFVWEKLREVVEDVPSLFHKKEDHSKRRISAVDSMLKELEFSEEITKKFLDGLPPQHRPDVKVNAVNLRNWLYCEAESCYAQEIVGRLPPELEDIKTKFKAFLEADKPNASITWHDELSHCTLVFRTDIGEIELGVSFLQAAVLYMFNESSELTITEISEWTKIEESVLRDILKSLVSERILYMVGKLPVVEDTYRLVTTPAPEDIGGFGDKQLHHLKLKVKY